MRFKQNFKMVLKDFDDNPLRAGGDPALVTAVNRAMTALGEKMSEEFGKQLDEIFGKPQTLGALCITAILSTHEDEKNLGEQERMRRFELGRRISKATKPEKDGFMEFNTEERDLIKKLVGKRYQGHLVPPLIWEALEEAEKVKDKEVDG